MYFTQLPNHAEPGFNEKAHFHKFETHNIVFNADSSKSNCDYHVGCLSIKRVLSGEEWYGIENVRIALRPGSLLILNNDQPYSSCIDNEKQVRVQSFFFKKDFAKAILQDALRSPTYLLEYPFEPGDKMPEFFQALHVGSPQLQNKLSDLITALDIQGYSSCLVDEHLTFLLHEMIGMQYADLQLAKKVNGIKSSTQKEIFKRLCITRDILHSSYKENPDLDFLSRMSCLSVPQLIRQFKRVFGTTPHQYLCQIKLKYAAESLKLIEAPVQEIAWECGFENISAFCRAFKASYRLSPTAFRRVNYPSVKGKNSAYFFS
jgi:AraC family transcriptional regulator